MGERERERQSERGEIGREREESVRTERERSVERGEESKERHESDGEELEAEGATGGALSTNCFNRLKASLSDVMKDHQQQQGKRPALFTTLWQLKPTRSKQMH